MKCIKLLLILFYIEGKVNSRATQYLNTYIGNVQRAEQTINTNVNNKEGGEQLALAMTRSREAAPTPKSKQTGKNRGRA